MHEDAQAFDRALEWRQRALQRRLKCGSLPPVTCAPAQARAPTENGDLRRQAQKLGIAVRSRWVLGETALNRIAVSCPQTLTDFGNIPMAFDDCAFACHGLGLMKIGTRTKIGAGERMAVMRWDCRSATTKAEPDPWTMTQERMMREDD